MSEKTKATKEEKTQALVVPEAPGALATASDLDTHAGQGTEGIGTDEIRPPQLTLAQGGHPQVKRNSPEYIQGLQEGDLFNDLTKEKYAQPLNFIVLRRLGKRAIEFSTDAERKAGAPVVKDGNVPLNDPRTQFTVDNQGNSQKPRATVFADYLVLLPDSFEVVTISFKGRDLGRNGVATQLNSLLKYPIKIDGKPYTNPPAWARTFKLGSTGDTDGTYNWSVYTLVLAGVTDAENRQLAATLYEQYKAATITVPVQGEVVDAEPSRGADEDVPF